MKKILMIMIFGMSIFFLNFISACNTDNAFFSGATTCTYPSIDNWAINCADNCNLTSEIPIVNKGNVTLTGSGTFNVQSGGIICFSDTGQYVNVNSGCSINIESGGSINKVGTCIPP